MFLLQFEGSVQPEWMAQLKMRGVELLNYVPDDAFVARFRGDGPEAIQSLPFVRWIDTYRPEQKLDRAFLAQTHQGAARDLEIAALIATDAAPSELSRLRGFFRGNPGERQRRLGTIWRGKIPSSQLANVAASSAVIWIESAPQFRLFDESTSALIGGPATNHLTFSQALGFDGNGVTVAVADSGLHNGTLTNHTELFGRTKAVLFYGNLPNGADENGHGTHVAGIIAGRGITGEGDEFGYYGLGVAPGAQLVVQRVFDGAGVFNGPPVEVLAQDAVRHGAIVGNNSWGQDSQGRYDLSAAEFDEFVRDADTNAPGDQPFLTVFSAGNAGPGPQTISSPAVGKNVIAVGATQGPRTNFFNHSAGPEEMASFSSRGPCEDGRIKPDLVAPGTWVASLLSPLAPPENVAAPINNEFAFLNGTSQAAPHISGAAAVFIQYYRNTYYGATPSPALVKAALINTADDLDGESLSATAPNMDEGWGRANVAALVQPDRVFEFLDQSSLLAAGQTYLRSVIVTRTNVPLKITLAYTDFPGLPAAVPALVNDLDLELTAPDGRTYRGNQFSLGESIPGAPARDAINNVEAIHLAHPLRGEYILRVKAQSIPQDSRRDSPGADQDFALAISGGMPARSDSVVLVDRPTYRAPGRIQIKVLDPDLIGEPSVVVRASSQSEVNGEYVTLLRSGNTFTGSVQTVIAGAGVDGKLLIAHTNWIRVEYLDASSQVTRVAMATADLAAPIITNVGSTFAFGQVAVTWETDEPASSMIRYGMLADNLNLTATNGSLTTTHVLELNGLQPGMTYFFKAMSTDGAGNAATNDNNGMLFSFTSGMNATVLIVDAYEADLQDRDILISTYTNPLSDLGISYDVWSYSTLGSLPELAALRPYPIVIWRINDSFRRPTDSIPPAQQEAIRQYLDAGGSLFLASMNILTRLLNQNATSFVTNVLHVQRFVLNPDQFTHCTNCNEDFRVPSVRGVAGDPIGQGMNFTLDYSNYDDNGWLGPDYSDTFTPSTNASPFLLESLSGTPCAMRFPRTGQDSAGRVVFASVPLDAIPDFGLSPNSRADFLWRSIQFLSPGVGGIGTLALSQGTFTLPDLVTIELADSDLERMGSVTVSVASASHTTPVTVTLTETVRPGLFRGVVPVARPGGSSTAGTVEAIDDDTIYVRYQDASTERTVEVTAGIDAIAPGIGPVAVRAGFMDATVTWNTSEPTDALIQFGESFFLGRTVYTAGMSTQHSLRLVGLVPGRMYYYKITVRDAAGNLAIDNNQGQFQTLVPLQPPFFEDAESATITNWTVVSTDDSQREWSVGAPQDDHTSQPCPGCSGQNAWASNIYGESADIIDTYLISPALDLRGANVAQLTFMHDYDFIDRTGSDSPTEGRLMISTNAQSDPVSLAEYHGYITNWKNVVVDLTPYAGRVVFLIWNHRLRTASPAPPVLRPGWVIDEIRVTASNVTGGTIRVVNNISQARFSVQRGALIQSGQGMDVTLTNFPPGTNVITFGDVRFYTTPPSRTNVLSSGSQVSVLGIYSFADVNGNGMSDDWEMFYFGNLNQTGQTDADGDGFTDHAEFIAGTHPRSPNSHLFISDPFPISEKRVRFNWPATPGRSYQLQGRDVNNPSWVPLSTWIRAPGDSATVFIEPPTPPDSSFYRVVVQP